ncbi:trans-resveratrol di-O-methyltransferase-like [Punica granatum]|uniref:Trans-resveratrol di-O-methyltransferase-like n=1 Tax=Punica granatum TaxID=22663 RepID=A0A6P8DB30_PUNGR|nr:trans-resveratrol di-O-methyltransferase-like [Punica granatum]
MEGSGMNKTISGNARGSLVHAQTHIWNHIFSFVKSMSLKCAVQLGIPDIIHNHGGPMTINELVSALSVHPGKAHCISRLMRILVHSGFFEQTSLRVVAQDDREEVGYALNNVSSLLLKDNPLSTRPYALAMLDPALMNSGHCLGAWFLNDDPTPFSTEHGSLFFEHMGNGPEQNLLFNNAMASDARLLATEVLGSDCKRAFEGLRSLVDVGGGTGTMAKAIAAEFPDLECTVFDLPHVVAGLKGTKNVKYVGGNMFKEIPPADAYLLKWIIHDWSDEESVKILKRCKDGLREGKGCKLIIVDIVLGFGKEDEESVETQLFCDMQLMIILTGKERTEREWAKLFVEAGFRDYKITPMLGLRSLIEVYP